MFAIGEYVVCGNNGVCLIKDITTLRMNGVDKNRKYYILKPVYAESSTVYVPVDTLQASMRKVLSKEEADLLLAAIPEIQILTIRDEKTVELQYKECMQSNSCSEWVKLLKTLHFRKKCRLEKGHKVTAVDSRYYKLAEENLCGELAVALGMSKSEVEEVIADKME
ncbi:MAG: CarD family transcriptional regulator [Lachnospiraceae bacterium]|nr:CarD family transcriptional regulator [Lachnospiraceae bacterium]MBQ7780926.1 CarD family transcriptional regulator [Lachnospiraceae bacterium]